MVDELQKEIDEAIEELEEEEKPGVEFEFKGDPDGIGPLPHGKYKFTGPKAVIIIAAISFACGVSVGIGLQ